MKKHNIFLIVLTLYLVSCFQEPDGIGFLSDDIYLKGADTIYIPLGGKGETDYAWTDDSSIPLNFSIENVRDVSNNTSEQFFEKYIYRTWIRPYDFLIDKTEEQVLAKLQDVEVEPIMINPVNGQLIYTEATSNLSSPGDVYYVDAKVENSSGSKLFTNYAILKLTSEARSFTVSEVINGISIVSKDGENNFVLYDEINDGQPDFIIRRNNIYADNGKEFVRIYKVADEPSIGIRVIFRFIDSNDQLFNPAEYATYSTGTYSYIDHSINRQNTSDGMILEFPATPWPTDINLRSYLRGPTYNDFSTLNIDNLYEDFKKGKVPSLVSPQDWPTNNWVDALAWFVRIRSIITFYESGTWKVECKIPYTAIDGSFN